MCWITSVIFHSYVRFSGFKRMRNSPTVLLLRDLQFCCARENNIQYISLTFIVGAKYCSLY